MRSATATTPSPTLHPAGLQSARKAAKRPLSEPKASKAEPQGREAAAQRAEGERSSRRRRPRSEPQASEVEQAAGPAASRRRAESDRKAAKRPRSEPQASEVEQAAGPAASRRRAEGPPSGFTLIEIMAAVTIFALLAGLIAPRIGSMTARTLRQRAERIAARLELARQRSVLTGVPHRLLLDLEEGGYQLEWQVTEAEAEGREPEPPAPLDLRGETPIPMAPVLAEERTYRPVPGLMGKFEWLEDDLAFAGVQTPEGWVERGEVSIEFERDGTASYTEIHLDDESGRTVVLDVLPLADAVRIGDATS